MNDSDLYKKAVIVQSEDPSRIGQVVIIPPSVTKAILKQLASMEPHSKGGNHA